MKCIEDEIPFDVPEGWEFSRLQTIISLNSGKSIKVRQLEEEGKYPVYGGNGINGYYDDYNVYSNTIIIGRVGFYCGSIHLTSEKSWITDNALIVSVKTPVFIQDFFAEILRFLDLGKTSVSTAQPVVSGKGILPLIIPVPPIAEQERIILKFQEMISEVDKIEHDKDSLSDITNITKAKILDLAIRGKLVPQNPNDEPASILLERIRKEKIELIKQGKMKRDKKESIIYKGDDNSYYLTGSSEAIDIPFEIPDTWEWSNLKELCNYGVCDNISPETIDDKAWILDLEDIEKDTGKILYRASNAERKTTSTKHSFQKNMILYSKLRPYLNKVVLADDKGFCTSEIIPLDFSKIIVPRYAQIFLMSPYFVGYASHCSYGMKMPRLGTRDGERALFAIPPYQEQIRIIDMVDRLFAELLIIQDSFTM